MAGAYRRVAASMENLRRARRLACLVLAWFALSVGVAVASPVLKPPALELICSGSGSMKVLVTGDGGAPDGSSHLPDCWLCVTTCAPPVALIFTLHQPPAHAPTAALPVPVAARTAPPLSARGPPLL